MTRQRAAILTLPALLLGACDWPLDNPLDPARCGSCAEGESCYKGRCIQVVHKDAAIDTTVDAAAADMATPPADGPSPDGLLCLGKPLSCPSDTTRRCGANIGACCSSGNPVFCDVAGGGGCFVDGVDCSTITSCGGTWQACKVGETAHCGKNRPFACCKASSTFCDVVGPASGCWGGSGVDCSTVTSCGGKWSICKTGETPHCGVKRGALSCCSATQPVFCDVVGPASGCWGGSADCSTVTSCGGKWSICKTGETPHCGAKRGTLDCCKAGETYCDVVGPSSGCWGGNGDCSTVTSCNGAWHACAVGGIPKCGAKRGFDCCWSTTEVFCDIAGDGGGCWGAGVVCSTIVNCSGTWHACGSASQHYDCTSNTCVAN